MANIRSLFGKRVKQLRRKEKLTQARLVEKVDVSVNYVSQIETGQASPAFDMIIRLANALGGAERPIQLHKFRGILERHRMNMDERASIDYTKLGQQLEEYCRKYSIPIEHFFEIVNDQKVVPMLRGKGMEYNVYLILRQILDPRAWVVTKLNLGAQPGTPDQDISITHRKTGEVLVIESKSAVRGSMTTGVRARHHKVGHFKVKCHRSRSFIGREGNDRYRATDFDVLITNPSNALFAGGTIGEELELIDDPTLIELLFNHYGVTEREALLQAAASDWRFVIPSHIADADGFIPRTPVVYLQDDPHWRPLTDLQSVVEAVVRRRVDHRRSGRSS